MELNKALNEDLEEYYRFKTYRDELDLRLDQLKERIKKRLIALNSYDVSETIDYYGAKGLRANLKAKRRYEVNQEAVEDIFIKKGLWNEYKQTHLPEHAIEEAYLNGDISDAELREIKEMKYSLSLHVEEVPNV